MTGVLINWRVCFNFAEFLGQLQIAESEEDDKGKYECVAENSVGTQYSYSAQLYVRGKKRNTF